MTFSSLMWYSHFAGLKAKISGLKQSEACCRLESAGLLVVSKCYLVYGWIKGFRRGGQVFLENAVFIFKNMT